MKLFRWIMSTLGAGMLAVLVVASPASANPVPGGWCHPDGSVATIDGKAYVCADGHWKPVVPSLSPTITTKTPSTSPSATPSLSPSRTSASPTTATSSPAATSATPSLTPGGSLPVTGTAIPAIIMIGIVLVAVGTLVLALRRHRRVTFRA